MTIEHADNNQGSGKGKQLSIVPLIAVLARRNLMERTLEKVVPGKNRFMILLWLLAIAAVVALFSNIQGEATQFYGIAESEQQSISFQYPVEIVEVPVVEGEEVAENAVLLQVRRYDLDVNIAVINEKINEIEAERDATLHSVTAEITSLQAERGARVESINTDIDSLDSRYQLNQALVNSISSTAGSGKLITTSPILTKLSGLRAEKKQVSKMFQARIELQKQKLADISGPSEARMAEFNRQKTELIRQSEALVVRAPFAGSVGSVIFKPGEQVDAFNPVISVHGASTRHIKGFIHEAVINDIRVGQYVWVKALGAVSDDLLLRGVVESLGSRIVEYPERLKRSVFVSAWGREAIIRIAPGNTILLGEKVSVLLKRPQPILAAAMKYLDDYLPISAVRAWVGDGGKRPGSPDFIDVRVDGLRSNPIEASGVTWNPASQSYLLVSDEHSALFEMSSMGEIIAEHRFDPMGKIDDIESISRDGDQFYIAASLSHNKRQKLKSKRRKLIHMRIDAQGVHTGGSVDLYSVLGRLRDGVQLDANTQRFLDRGIGDKSLDLEAHAVIDQTLYLGFKAPLDADRNTVFLKLENVGALFAGEAVKLSPWLRLKLGDIEPHKSSRLSDFSLSGDKMYMLSVGEHEQQVSSYLWRYDLVSHQLEIIAEYKGLRAEGLSIDPDRNQALVVFDGAGQWPSQYLYTPI